LDTEVTLALLKPRKCLLIGLNKGQTIASFELAKQRQRSLADIWSGVALHEDTIGKVCSGLYSRAYAKTLRESIHTALF